MVAFWRPRSAELNPSDWDHSLVAQTPNGMLELFLLDGPVGREPPTEADLRRRPVVVYSGWEELAADGWMID